MRNHFFLILVLASLFAFMQNFAEGKLNFFPGLSRTPAQASTDAGGWVITETTEYNASSAR